MKVGVEDLLPGKSARVVKQIVVLKPLRVSDRSRDHGDLTRARREEQYHPLGMKRSADVEHPSNLGRVHVGGQGVRRARPLRRRRDKIARPARVRMRIRKPCVFARWRLFG